MTEHFEKSAYALAAVLSVGCLPYMTHDRDSALIEAVDVNQTLDIAQMELEEGGTGSSLTIWAIRDQPMTPEQAERVSELYNRYIDELAGDFDVWHLAWAVSNIYRLGDDAVQAAIEPAYEDASRRAAALHAVANEHVNGERVYMGHAHAGGRAYAKRHVVAPGNERYLQAVEDYLFLEGRADEHSELWESPGVRDYTPKGWIRQPSFVSHAGTLNKNEHAAVLTVDGEVLPPAVMLGYRYGLLYWWEIGADVGGDYGVFQALLHMKMENYKTAESERFYWGTSYKTGFKHHVAELTEKARFDDRSWVVLFENSFALRLGDARDKSIYLVTQFYIDLDLHEDRRQTDYYVAPALFGFESVLGSYSNLFIQAGAAYSINGMEMADGEILYEGDWFPVVQLGFGYRTGDRTAIYYGRKTRHMAERR